jgi:hypothetical protein
MITLLFHGITIITIIIIYKLPYFIFCLKVFRCLFVRTRANFILASGFLSLHVNKKN